MPKKISDIPEVLFPVPEKSVEFRYVAATLEDETGNKKKIFWSDGVPESSYSDILAGLEGYAEGLTVTCRGGGRLYFNRSIEDELVLRRFYFHPKREIDLESRSHFGKEDPRQTIAILRRAFPEFIVVLELHHWYAPLTNPRE